MIILSKLALSRRSVTIMALALIVAAGVYGYQQLQQELFPEISLKVINVVTSYQQGTPTEVAENVTTPIENVTIGMDGLKEVTSTSSASRSTVQASFETNANIEEAEAEIVSRVAGVRLPDDAGDPRIFELTPNQRPVMELSVSGERDIPDLLTIIEGQIVPRLESVSGVYSVELEGGVNEQVFVTVDPDLLDTYGLTLQRVIGAIQGHEVDVTAGSLVTDGRQVTLRAFYGYTSLDAIANLPVGFARAEPGTGSRSESPSSTTPVRISDVAEVRIATPEAATVSRTNGQPSVGLEVQKNPDGNTIELTRDIEIALAELSGELPPDISMEILESQAPRLEQELNKVISQGFQGFAFAVLAVFLFLLQFRRPILGSFVNSLRPTIIIAVSIPLSIMLTMVVMAIFNWTLNFMSLAGLAIAVGRIVDDSIVVLENIYRHIQMGSSRSSAVIEATQEVSAAIVASTLTTVAVFVPLGFLPGVVGQFFLPFAQTVCVSLVASTLVALTAVPVLASIFLKQGDMANEPSEVDSNTWLQMIYVPILKLALRFRVATVVSCIAVVLASLSLILLLPIELFSGGNTEAIRVDVTLNESPSTGLLYREVRSVEQVLDEYLEQGYIESYQATLGSGSRSFGPSAGDASYDRAGFNIALTDGAPADLDEQLRARLPGNEQTTVRVFSDEGGPRRGGFRLTLTGSNYADVRTAASILREEIEKDPGVRNVRTNIVDGKEELTIAINPDDAGRYGLSTQNVANQIRTWVNGTDVGEVNLEGDTLDLVVRGVDTAVNTHSALQQLPIAASVGVIPLSSVSDTRNTLGPRSVTHYDGNRSATISGSLADRDAGAIGERIDNIVASTQLPPGVRVRTGGVFSDIREEFSNVYVAMIIGVSLVYLVMVATLGSLKVPFIVVLSMPLAIVGGLVALVLADLSLSLPALMGFLFLIGIVVTNAIVLLTFVNQLRNRGLPPLEAVMEAGRTRVRPILMTAFTTILALIPLALSDASGLVGAELATVVIGGLVSATFLTLVAVPVVYMLLEDSIPGAYRRVLSLIGRQTEQPTIQPLYRPTQNTD